MLTFEFSGVEGKMTVTDCLTSGMAGRQAAISLDDSWAGLAKTVVFRAGQVCRTAALEASTVTIPADVLIHPFCRLYVGVYGTDEAGTLVIPTIMAEGPYIRYGADPTSDPTAEELPVWRKLQDQIGNLSDLDTEAKENLVAAINELHAELPNAGQGSGGGSGLSAAAAALLIEILRQALYSANQSAKIDALEAELSVQSGSSSGDENTGGESGDGGGSEVTEKTLTSISAAYSGGDVAVGTSVTALTGIVVKAFYSDGSSETVTGYTLSGTIAEGSNTITVSYGGKTATFTVTGVASGGETTDPVTYTVTNDLTNVTTSNSASSVTGGAGYSAVLSAASGYILNTVTVTMGGADVTASVYTLGQITIAAVTGDLVITAAAVKKQTASTEVLELVCAESYPNVTTFQYTERASAWMYTIAKQGQLRGGLLSVDYDPEMANSWNLNLYVFDAAGNPYCQTDKDSAWAGESAPTWEDVGAGSGFGVVFAPFTVQIPEDCTFIACFRLGNNSPTGSADVIADSTSFSTWAMNGGITFTVTTYA